MSDRMLSQIGGQIDPDNEDNVLVKGKSVPIALCVGDDTTQEDVVAMVNAVLAKRGVKFQFLQVDLTHIGDQEVGDCEFYIIEED